MDSVHLEKIELVFSKFSKKSPLNLRNDLEGCFYLNLVKLFIQPLTLFYDTHLFNTASPSSDKKKNLKGFLSDPFPSKILP